MISEGGPTSTARSAAAQDPALEAFPEALVSSDTDGCITRWNAPCEELLGLTAEQALGRPRDEVLRLVERDTTGQFPDRLWAVVVDRRVAVEVIEWHAAGGAAPLTHLCLRSAVHRLSHESALARTAEELRVQARSDALTGLANRYELEERLAAALSRTSSGQVALVVIDLDGFKPINDTFGHSVGDEVLAAIGARLRAAVREGDTVGRLGGDEFVVLTWTTDAVSPAAVTARLREALADPVSTSAGMLRVGASLGIAVGAPGGDAGDLLRRADKAMYRVKLLRG